MHLYFFSKIKIYIHRLLYHIEHQCAVRTECASERAWRHAVRVGRALEFDTQPPSVFCLWCASLQHELPSPTTCWEIRVRIHMVSFLLDCWSLLLVYECSSVLQHEKLLRSSSFHSLTSAGVFVHVVISLCDSRRRNYDTVLMLRWK